MHKKIYIQDIDIPKDDIECWEKYPKYRWVYEASRLLDAQHIKWSPFETSDMTERRSNMTLNSQDGIKCNMGYIFTNAGVGDNIIADIYITKGEIKLIKFIDKSTSTELTGDFGALEIRISAFVSMYFQKFTGVLSVDAIGTDIFYAQLRPFLPTNSPEVTRLLKRIYKKQELNIIGLTDQALREPLAS